MNHHPFRQNPPPHHANEPQVFDLCASEDEEQDVDFTAEHRATFLGVRREDKSPRFNANSRHVFSPNAAAAARRPSVVKPPPTTTTTSIDNDDDIVECWSSEDEEGNTKPRARRVTNDEPWNRLKQRNHSNDVASRKHAPRSSSTFHHSNNDDDHDDFDRMPAPSRQKNVLNQFKANGNKKRRLRDATTGMHSAASIPFHRNINTNNPTRRNDLHGGSGVGMGNYTFTSTVVSAIVSTTCRSSRNGGGRKQKAATKKTGGKKRGGGGKRSYYRKKGGGKKKKSTSGSRGGGAVVVLLDPNVVLDPMRSIRDRIPCLRMLVEQALYSKHACCYYTSMKAKNSLYRYSYGNFHIIENRILSALERTQLLFFQA